MRIPLVPPGSASRTRRRVDVKLFRRGGDGVDAAAADAAALDHRGAAAGFHGIGVYGIKSSLNIGTLWRSAYQLGSSFLFTIGGRYELQTSDTLAVPARLPLMQLEDWAAFCESAPHGTQWVAVEMGDGEDLDEFEHPERAVYLLGAEDTGLPANVVRACHHHVALPSARSASYNVAMAGSIVMYDRLAKERARERADGRDETLLDPSPAPARTTTSTT